MIGSQGWICNGIVIQMSTSYGLVYQSVVDEVQDDLEDAAEAGGQGDPQVDLISSGVGDVFLWLCPKEADQEVVSGEPCTTVITDGSENFTGDTVCNNLCDTCYVRNDQGIMDGLAKTKAHGSLKTMVEQDVE